MKEIRTFIAINLPADVRSVLAAVGEELAAQVPEKAVRWVEPDNLHLTLSFLGNTPENRIDEIVAGLDRVTAQYAPFTLRLDALGCFPNERRPRVIWVGVGGEVKQAQRLKQAIDEMLQPLGWEPEDRPFRAHLTVGRVKRKHRQIALPWGKGVLPRPVPVDAVHLMESRLRPGGPIYTVLHSSKLGS